MVNQIGYQHLLPKLIADPSVSSLERAGVWTGHSGVLMTNVSESLSLPNLGDHERTIDSIPDIWARPLLFGMALFNSAHPLHKKVVAEWRGLLAVLALHEKRKLKLYSKHLDLANLEPHQTFLKAAGLLCPQDSIAPDTDWKSLHVLFQGERPQNTVEKGKPIGITSPLTLVCTAIDLRGALKGKVAWAAEDSLQDPTLHLTLEEKNALNFWLVELVTNLQNYPEAKKRIKNDLVGLLKTFIRDLGQNQAVGDPPELSNKSLGLTSGVYRLIDKPIKLFIPPLTDSAVRLRPSEGFNPSIQLLVLDPELASKWAVTNPATISIAGGETLATIDFNSLDTNNRSRLGDQTLVDFQSSVDFQWRKPEDFFTEKLLLVLSRDPKPFPGALEVNGQRDLVYKRSHAIPILPLKKEILNYLSPSKLATDITIRAQGDNIIVEVTLPLAYKKLTIEHVYTPSNIEVRNTVPILDIWPNFQSKGWNVYYTYSDSSAIDSEDIFTFTPHWTQQQEANPVSRNLVDPSRIVTRSNKPPATITCTANIRRKDVEVGCLLLKSLPEVLVNQSTWNFGMDFGRSASHIYVLKVDEETNPISISLTPKLFSITPLSVGTEARQKMDRYFIPSFEPETPFLTLFRPEGDISNVPPQFNTQLLKGNIVHTEPQASLQPGAIKRDGVKYQFKFEDTKEEREYSIAFIKELALQCLAEAAAQGVSNVNWYASYPSAFSWNLRQLQSRVWNEVVTMTRTLKMKSNPIEEQTESVAAARFFACKDGIPLISTICIDIGGGTSDISVWNNSSLLLQSSIKFAGENVFMNVLKEYPEVLEKLDTKMVKELLVAKHSASFCPEADSLMRSKRKPGVHGEAESDELLSQLSSSLTDDPKDPLYGLLHLIALGTGGLIFYAGLMVGHLRTNDKWNKNTIPNLCVGGNGARMFDWLGAGQFDTRTPHNRLFQEVLKTASGLDKRQDFMVQVSSIPKAEAAYGLIVKSELNLDEANGELLQIAGEGFFDAQNRLVSSEKEITAELLVSGLSAPRELKQLRTFVKVFNTYAANRSSFALRIDLEAVEETILEDLQQNLNNMRGQDASDVRVQPLFIIALKKLLELEITKWRVECVKNKTK